MNSDLPLDRSTIFLSGFAPKRLGVAALVNAERASSNFPHYNTLDTSLTPTEVNLLSNLTCWGVTNRAKTFTGLFADVAV